MPKLGVTSAAAPLPFEWQYTVEQFPVSELLPMEPEKEISFTAFTCFVLSITAGTAFTVAA